MNLLPFDTKLCSHANQFTYQASSVSATNISCFVAVIRFFKVKYRVGTTLFFSKYMCIIK